MKKTTSIILALGLLVALSACTVPAGKPADDTITATTTVTVTATDTTTVPPQNTTASPTTIDPTISKERAIEIALNAAGLKREAVYDLEAELDRVREGLLWEVDFETKEQEYAYDIDATDGTVVKVEREKND